MTISNIDGIIDVCKEHVDKTGSQGSLIENILIRFLIVHICGEYEKEIKRIIVERAKKTGDKELASYLARTKGIKALTVHSMKGDVLGKFNPQYVELFDSIVPAESITRYSNIVTNRHSIAHGTPVQMSFDEVVLSHSRAKDVLSAFAKILIP